VRRRLVGWNRESFLFVKAAVFWGGWRERGAKGQRVQAGRMQQKGAIGQWGGSGIQLASSSRGCLRSRKGGGRGGHWVSLNQQSSEGSRIGKGWERESE
jgi:hypothetical protein